MESVYLNDHIIFLCLTLSPVPSSQEMRSKLPRRHLFKVGTGLPPIFVPLVHSACTKEMLQGLLTWQGAAHCVTELGLLHCHSLWVPACPGCSIACPVDNSFIIEAAWSALIILWGKNPVTKVHTFTHMTYMYYVLQILLIWMNYD